MKYILITCLVVILTVAGGMTLVHAGDQAADDKIKIPGATELMAAQKVDKVRSNQDPLLQMVETSSREFTRLRNDLIKVVSYFHQRKIDEAIVEKNYVRYMFNSETEELIEETRKWRDDLPEHLPPIISPEEAESMAEGDIQCVKLYYISPSSEIFHFDPVPKNPCWIITSIIGDSMTITVIDAITGKKVGNGVPPPYEGLSIHGPDREDPPKHHCDNSNPLWYDHAKNAHDWFETMGYDTIRIGSATQSEVQSHIQSDTTAMFYELDHGGSTIFQNRCEDYITASAIESWISSYASMPFAFIGSCGGLSSTTDGTFAYEFRKGLNYDTVVVGYDDMSGSACALDCWGNAIAWQTELFSRMNNGYTVGQAYAYANAAYPDCTNDGHNCMRIVGDTNLKVAGSGVSKVQRSKCGALYNAPPLYLSPFPGRESRTYNRPHYIRGNCNVPSGCYLTITPSNSNPYVDLLFLNNSKLTVYGTFLSADATNGEVTFVSEQDRSKGIKLPKNSGGQIKMYNGGELKVYK